MRGGRTVVGLLILGSPCLAEMLVATVGDSFADALYLAMKVRPDLLRKNDIKLVRWSRANVGFTRLDVFDYPAWLRDTATLGQASLCVGQIGSNDIQSIRTGKLQWAYFGTPAWKELYAARFSAMIGILESARCKQVVWVLQPRFEKSPVLAKGRVPVNEVQSRVLSTADGVAFDVVTTERDYQFDNIHYGRALMLRMGPALLEIAAAARLLQEGDCRSCHGPSIAGAVYAARPILPLRLHERK